MATKRFGTRAILKKKDGNDPMTKRQGVGRNQANRASSYHHHHRKFSENAFFYASSRSTFISSLNYDFIANISL
jgi:hypothetical protein